MSDTRKLLAKLPKMDKLMQSTEFLEAQQRLGRDLAKEVCQEEVDKARKLALDEGKEPNERTILENLAKTSTYLDSTRLKRVVNATGVVLHTNLGRAPYGANTLTKLSEELEGYTNLEIDLAEGRRGVRSLFTHRLLAAVCGAPAGLVVNNNAAALYLVLSTFAKGKEVVVSRGELVQIGGGFRIPDILSATGAILREVGTTNITTFEDYQQAIGEDTAMVLKVHHSNFRVRGFTRDVGVRELAKLKSDRVMLVKDLGSGYMGDLSLPGLDELTVRQTVSDGADLVCCSGDKLFGGPQAGLILGEKELVARLGKAPMMRILRPDKCTLFMMQHALKLHAKNETNLLPSINLLTQQKAEIEARVRDFLKQHSECRAWLKPVECRSAVGAGSAPDVELESFGLALKTSNAEAAARWFRKRPTPVVGIVQNDRFLLDFRTVFPCDFEDIADTAALWAQTRESC